ncbi:MAG: tryptophan--tRNA ligase [Gammaproteobacteria bacterium]|nr:tryptophan--tRNA ligase [Gammaproteobacteria bacterium]
MASSGQNNRVVSGVRPTGGLHLGNYHGALKNWVALQNEYECYFFVADWHALTTNYDDSTELESHVQEIIIDWLAAGLNPNMCTMFIQSRVAEHAELHLLLSMITPLSWLERVPTYKDQQEKLKGKDLGTYGFLGYPLLQSADILLYRPAYVPVGADQVAHVEITREIARRFNHLYGREPGFEEKANDAIRSMGGKNAKLYKQMRKNFQEKGELESLEKGKAMVMDHASLTLADRERLLGYLEGGGRNILVEPEVLLTPTPKVPGLDGQKMSKSYNNTIGLREDPDAVVKKLRTMQTDPARVRRTDPGDPEKCPVWELHKIYSDQQTLDWVKEGCTTAGIGCLDCKKKLIDRVVPEIEEMRARAKEYEDSPEFLRSIIAKGCEDASDTARDTMDEVRQAIGLAYR